MAKKIIFSLLLGFMPLSVNAAVLYFSEPAASYSIGQTFSVSVYAGSSDQAMNAASGVISFPWDKLEVVSVSKTGSIFSLWVQEPSFLNSAGNVSFEGIVLNPGFTGGRGKILTIAFKAKAAGQANLSFSSGSVLANDGTGTNILTNLWVAVVNISDQLSSLETLPAGIVSEDNAPAITSRTHPDQTKWYAADKPEFSWDLPEGALEVKTLIGVSSGSAPTISYTPPISDKKVDALSDGTYYFHLQIRTTAGWSGIAHYRVNIDTTPPKPFSIKFPHGAKGLEPRPIILFNTTDDQSGISHYDIRVGNSEPKRTASLTMSNPYSLPAQYPGMHTVIVSAVDRAGNSTSASADFTIEAIEAPIITYYQEEIEYGDIIKIRGITYPDSDVNILIKQDGKIISEELSRSNSSGDFSLIVTKRLDTDAYEFTARVTDERGARSDETKPLTIIVKSKFLTDLTTFILNYLSVIILVFLVLAGIIAAGIFIWYKFARIIRRLRRESKEAEQVLEKSFKILRKDVDEHITRLKKARSERNLTSEEVQFLEQFEEELVEAKEAIVEEVRDIFQTKN